MPNVELLKVPAGVRPSICSGHTLGGTCKARVYWIRERKKEMAGSAIRYVTRNTPVDCSQHQAPSEAADDRQQDLFGSVDVHEGYGVDHRLTCPDWKLIAVTAARRHEERESA